MAFDELKANNIKQILKVNDQMPLMPLKALELRSEWPHEYSFDYQSQWVPASLFRPAEALSCDIQADFTFSANLTTTDNSYILLCSGVL